MIIETHAHYDDKVFDEDRNELLLGINENGIEKIINVGAEFRGVLDSIRLSQEYDFIYAAIGVHPSEIDDLNEERLSFIKEKAKTEEKVVSIGEIGLDYHFYKDQFKSKDDEEAFKERQKYFFKRQLDIAKETDLPVIIHSRDAADDTFNIMKDAGTMGIRGVIHCYSYSPEMAKEYVKMGFYIGVGGVVTFKNGKKLKETVYETHLSNILLETDSPYLSPEPKRGQRNDSNNLHLIAEEIAKIKGVSKDEVCRVTRENANKLFFQKIFHTL